MYEAVGVERKRKSFTAVLLVANILLAGMLSVRMHAQPPPLMCDDLEDGCTCTGTVCQIKGATFDKCTFNGGECDP
jgi:hypothetical protein